MRLLDTLHLGIDSFAQYAMDDTTHWWHHSVHKVVTYVMPSILVVICVYWLARTAGKAIRENRINRIDRMSSIEDDNSPFTVGLFRFLHKYTWRQQSWLVAGAALSLPALYASLELPKNIINYAINSGHFPITVSGFSIEQVPFLFVLCSAFLVIIVISGGLKFAINLFKGKVAENLLRRFRILLHREWRRSGCPGGNAQLIPVLIQEIEPIGGFAGDIAVTPLFQGGTFLTILLFMFVQDPVLGAAAIALLPVQLAIIPRLQKKINVLSRDRVKQVRKLGASLDEPNVYGNRRYVKNVHDSFRVLQVIRIDIYRRKFLMKGLNNFLNHLSPFFFYTIGGYLVIDGNLSFGALVAVLGAHKDFASPLKELFRYYQTMEDVKVRYDEIQKFLINTAAGGEFEPIALTKDEPIPSSV
ncbi:MAG: ABC transporter ATP-binding protein [Rhodospirillales bacterium]|nr:ABC transporter ATP-binding protein [Rhodospirillales bacterium]MBT4626333.1 ABC transporter ATP-binding protein [Rhodospirillales bacterium]MBT5352954.1 ABC transporter ATP-binding protein [Rhodospirillales bacterium]MBT6111880.1 ABC transporter ATP-binding protein [Rhodospirillales bacterium]MBT6825989.1 ABC transporter ATP-binding protein [Rhodospirillales bacterium]